MLGGDLLAMVTTLGFAKLGCDLAMLCYAIMVFARLAKFGLDRIG
jgi:hypothetical protein